MKNDFLTIKSNDNIKIVYAELTEGITEMVKIQRLDVSGMRITSCIDHKGIDYIEFRLYGRHSIYFEIHFYGDDRRAEVDKILECIEYRYR